MSYYYTMKFELIYYIRAYVEYCDVIVRYFLAECYTKKHC